MKVLASLLLLVHLLKDTLAGTLLPEVVDSVLPYRNNEEAIGKYTFSFKMSSPVPSNPMITIDFPNIYPTLIANVDNCQGTVEVKLLNQVFNFSCSISGSRVTFNVSSVWSSLDAGNLVVEIFDVVNPSNAAGASTGYFQVRTWSGIGQVIDSNTAFDSIAFAPAYSLFTTTPSAVTIVNDGANVAGYTTNYILSFTTSYTYQPGTWFRVTFPTTFTFSLQMECYVIDLPANYSNLPCYNDGNVLVMQGLQQVLPPGNHQIKMKNVINPTIAVPLSPVFIFESLLQGVYTVIEYYDQIAGVTISPGAVTDASVVGFPLVQNLYVDYTIRFLPSNVVPLGGSIHIKFPPDFTQGIDSVCRISYGLTAATSAGLSCVTDGLVNLYISNFQTLIPQYIEVQCYAYNPPVAGQTQNFQVETYTHAYGSQIIDQNPTVGTVVISAIDTPNFMQIDFYQDYINCSYYTNCPINFRYFPLTNMTAPTPNHIFNPTVDPHNSGVASTYFNSISIQIPIWWLLMGQGQTNYIPECLFGTVPAAQCLQYQHVISLIIPSTQGYGYCELPVSINYVQVSPIPGNFPFRLWTFVQGSKTHAAAPIASSWSANNYATPLEQDTYIMDIPITGIAVLQSWNSASEAGDTDNLLHLRSNVHPFLFAWSGAIDVIITHVPDSLQDMAAWPLYGGKSAIPDNTWKEIPCKLYQSGSPAGYLSSYWTSKDLRCLLKVGFVGNNDPTHLMAVGFNANIDKGNYYEFYIPDITYCTTINRNCFVLYSYTMTEDYNFPYRISQRQQALGTVNPVQPAGYLFTTPNAQWGQSSRSSDNRCQGINLYMNLFHDQPMQATDYIVIKRDMGHWYVPFFRNNNYYLARTDIGFIGNPSPIFDKDYGQEYIVLRSPILVPATGPGAPAAQVAKTYYLSWITSSPFKNQVAITSVLMWTSKYKKIKATLFPTNPTNPNFGIYNLAQSNTDLYGGQPWGNQNYWSPITVSFQMCLDMPSTGEIDFYFQAAGSPTDLATNAYTTTPTVCRVWPGIMMQKSNGTEVSCNYDTVNKMWRITNFQYIPMMTVSKITWYHMYSATASVGALTLSVATYNISGNTATLSEWYGSPNPTWFSTPAITGTPLANNWQYLGHYQYAYDLYQGNYGKFVWEITTGEAMAWDPTESWTFVATMDGSVYYNQGTLECRYALKDPLTGLFGHPYPGVSCTYFNVPTIVGPPVISGTTKITMKLHPILDITTTDTYQIWIDTRSTDTLDGLQFNLYGVYSVNLESYYGGTKHRGGKLRYEIFGPMINHFAIWSSNKLVGDQTFLTYYVDFINTQSILASTTTLASYNTIMLYFDTQTSYVLGAGYASDLGMGTSLGYADQSVIPCNLILNIPYAPLVNTAICTLYYGYSEAPARIKIEGFLGFTVRVFRVDIPFVTNPTKLGVVPRTWLKVLQTTVAGVSKNVQVIWEGHYNELNTTWSRNTTRYPYSATSYANPITMTTTALNTIATLTLPFMTPQMLHTNDFVLIKLPIWWPAPFAIAWNTCAVPLLGQRCYSIRNDNYDTHYVYFQISGTLSSGSSISFSLPSPRSVIPVPASGTAFIQMYIYHDTRLIAINSYTGMAANMFIADPIVPTITCLPTSCITGQQNDYIVTFNLPHNLLSTSEIRIDYQDYTVTPNPNCTSTTSSLLTGPVLCSILPNPGSFSSVIDFNNIAALSQVQIRISLQNNAVIGLRNWEIRTYYVRGGYYYVNGDSGLVPHTPGCTVVAAAAVVNVPWPTWFHQFQRTRTGSYGPLVFIYQSSVTLTHNTPGDYVVINIPTAFQFASAEKAASWEGMYPYQWNFATTGGNNVITLWAPKTVDIVAGTRYNVNVTTLNALLNVNGFLYPNQIPGNYFATISVYKASTLIEQGTAEIFVFKPNFPQFEAKSYLINAGFKASFHVTFQLASAYAYGAVAQQAFIFRVPTTTYKYRQRINLFADDAGTGLTSGSAINCHFYDVVTRNPLPATCYFYKGSQDNGIPAYVQLMLSGNLVAANSYSITFDGFNHPTTSTDDMNVEPALEFYAPGGVWTYTGVDYDYTIATDNTFTLQNGYTPAPAWDTMIIGSTNIGVDLSFTTPVNMNAFQVANGVGWADYLIFEFPPGYVQSYNLISKANIITPVVGANGFVEFSAGNNWLIWRVNIVTLTAGTTYTVRLQNVNQAVSLPPVPVIRMLVVQNRELKTLITYAPNTGFTAPAIGPAEISLLPDEMPVADIPQLKYQRWALTFTHLSAPIPAGGAIQITLPATFTVGIDAHCTNLATSNLKGFTYNSATAPMDNLFCTYNSVSSSFVITNFAYSSTADTIRLTFYTTSPAVGVTGTVTIRAFSDVAMQYQILQGTVTTPAPVARYGFSQLVVSPYFDEVPDVARDGDAAEFTFEYRVPSTWTAATTLTVTIPSNAVVPTSAYVECFFGVIEAADCIVTSTAPLTLKILAPHSPALTIGTQYTVVIRSRCGPNGERGLIFSATSSPVTVTVFDGTTTLPIPFEIFAPNFLYIQPMVMHSNTGLLNGFAFTFKPTVGIPSGGAIIVKFPRSSSKGRYNVWGSMGTTGTYVTNKCMHLSGLVMPTATSLLTCYYYEDGYYNIFQMSGFSNQLASVQMGVVIYDIMNPTTTNDYLHVDAILETVDAAGNLLNQGVAWDLMSVYSPAAAPTTTIVGAGYTRLSNTLGATAVSYTFSSISITVGLTDQIVFDFPFSYYFTGNPGNCNSAAVTGTYTAYGKYVVFRPTASVSGIYNLCFNGVTNPSSADPGQIRILIVNNRVFSNTIMQAANAWTNPNVVVATLSTAATGNNIGSGAKYTITVPTTSVIPARGAIAFKFPSTYTLEAISVFSGFPAGSTFSIDLSTVGFVIGVIQTPTEYSQATDGVAIFDVYVKTPATVGPFSIVVSGYSFYVSDTSYKIFTATTISTTLTSTAAVTTCYLSGVSFSAGVSTTIAGLSSMIPALTAITYTTPAVVGYDMVNIGASNCNGMPIYTTAATTLTAGIIDLYHLTIKKPNLLNALTVTGTTPIVFNTFGKMAIDFGNHDLPDLGYGLTNNSVVPCDLTIGGVEAECLCTLNLGNMYQDPGVVLTFYTTIPSGSTIEVALGKFSNPVAVKSIEVRFRYYELIYGSRTQDMVSLTQLFSITDYLAYATSVGGTITISTTTAQSSPSITFTLAALDTGNQGLIFSPANVNNKLTFSATTGVTNAYPGASFSEVSVITATSIATTLYDMPVSVPTATTWTVVTINSVTQEALYARTFTSAVTLCTPAVTLTALSVNNAVGLASYSLSWTSACDFPRGSVINIKINSFLTAYSIESYKLLSAPTTIQGTFTVTTDGTTIFIKNYNYIPAGTVQMELKVYSGTYNGAGATAGQFLVTHYGTNIVSLTPASALLTAGSGTVLSADRFRTFIPKMTPAIRSSTGYLSFIVQPVSAILTTDTFLIQNLVAAFASATPYLRCKFTNLAVAEQVGLSQACYYTSATSIITVKMPKVMTVSNANIYRLDIFYVDEQLFGFQYPGASGPYGFNVKLTDISGLTVKDEFVTNLNVMKQTPPRTCFRNFVSNFGLKNVFMVGFSTPYAMTASLPASTGYLQIQFPNEVVSNGVATSSFDRLTGQTVYNAQAIKCTGWTVTGATKTSIGGSLYGCYISYGGYSNIHRYTTVNIIHTGLAANTNYEFDIYGINNPSTTNTMSYVRMITGLGTDTDTIFTDNYQLYTVTAPTVTEATQTLAAFAPTTIQLPTNINLHVVSPTVTTLTQYINHVRLIYNTDMENPAMTATGFEPFDVIPGLAYFYTDTTTPVSFTMALQNFMTPASAVPAFVSSFEAQLIQQKIVISQVPFSSSQVFVAIPYTSITIPAAQSTVSSNNVQSFSVSLTLSKILSMTGSIELYVQNMASVMPNCHEGSPVVIGVNFLCQQENPTTLRISGFSSNLPVGTVININFRATTNTLTTGAVCSTAWNDYPALLATAQTQAVQTQTCFTLTYNAQPGIPWFEARTPTSIRRVQASANTVPITQERAMMTYPITFPAATLPMMVGSVVFSDTGANFGNIETQDFLCFFSANTDLAAKSCSYSAITKLWTVKAPRVTSLTGLYSITIVPTRQFFQYTALPVRANGILMPISGGSYPLTAACYDGGGTLIYTSPYLNVNLKAPHYTKHYLNSYLVMNDAVSTFHIKMQPVLAIPATPNGVIKIDFMINDVYGLSIFNTDLGTGILNGFPYQCPSATGGFVSNCRLFLGNANTYASILLDPATTMLPNTVYDIDFPSLLNPVLVMSEVIMSVTAQTLVAGTFVDLSTEQVDVFVAETIVVTPTALPALVWNPTDLTGQASTVSMTFTPTISPVKSSLTSFDKIVIVVDRTELVILNNQLIAGKILACAGYQVTIFSQTDTIQLSTTVGVPIGAPVTITCTNWFNQQYVIRGGVSQTVQLWVDGTITETFQYARNVANPNILTVKSVAISASTPEISSFDTYTFTIKPFNYMPVGSRFEIYFSTAFTGLTNCQLISGLNGGICQTLLNSGGFNHIRISMFQLWDPNVSPQIVFSIDMVSPPTAGTYTFNFESIWQENDITPALEDLIDQDTVGSITYIGYTPFTFLQLNRMYVYTREQCDYWWWEGVVQWKFAMKENFVYPHYLTIDRASVQWFDNRNNNEWVWVDPFQIQEWFCYFTLDYITYSAKSENCYFGADGKLYIMIPEELPLTSGNNYTISLDSRGQWDRGFSMNNLPSYRYYTYGQGVFATVPVSGPATPPVFTFAQSTAPLFFQERACYFGTRDYDSTNWHQSHNHSLEIQDSCDSSVGINDLLATRPIPRFQAQFSTFNEFKSSSLANLGWQYLTVENQTDAVPCMYWHHQLLLAIPANIMQAYDVGCEVSNVNPSYADYFSRYAVLTMYNYTNQRDNTFSFRFGWGGITNFLIQGMPLPASKGGGVYADQPRNTFAHMIIQAQTRYEDGTYLDQQRVIAWYHINQILPSIVDKTPGNPYVGNTVVWTPNQFGQMYVEQRAQVIAGPTIGGRVWAHWQLEDPWWHLTRNQTAGGRYCRNDATTNDARCNQYGVPYRWSVWLYNGVNGFIDIKHYGLMESPAFVIGSPTAYAPALYTKRIDVILESNQQIVKVYDGPLTCAERIPYYIFEMDDNTNPEGANMLYRIGVWSIWTYENNTNIARLWIPNDFSVIGPQTTNCSILFGFRRPNFDLLSAANSPLCSITPNDPSILSPSPNNYHRVEFYNLYRYSTRWFDQYESWMIFQIAMVNPATQMWPRPSAFRGFVNNQVWPLVNESRYDYRIDTVHNQGRSWVGGATPMVANYFRVVRNRLTFEERRQQAGQWAELHMRLYPKYAYPATDATVQIQIPDTYDIPNGGTNICQVGHDYHLDLDGQFCEITNERMIQVQTSQIMGLWTRCTIVRITTNGSVDNNNGFQAPQTPGVQDYNVNLYKGTQRLEYTGATGTPQPSQLIPSQTLNMTANVIEILKQSTLNVSFHGDQPIRAGYDTAPQITDPFSKPPQGVIYLKFNTIDKYTGGTSGFSNTLGYPNPPNINGVSPYQVPCHAFIGLVARAGQSLICTVTPQPFAGYYTPVVMTITNFEFIPANTMFIQVHILQLPWVQNSNNLAWIDFSVYEQYGDGTLQQIYADVIINLLAKPSGGVVQTTVAIASPMMPSMSPNIVGARSSLTVPFSTPIPLYQNDVVEVMCPTMMILPDASDISAVFKVTPNVATGIVPYTVVAQVVVYPEINRVNFILPRATSIYGCTIALPCSVNIVAAGFRNVPYEILTTLTYGVRIISQLLVKQNWLYTAVVPPTVGPFNSILAQISSQFSGDVYVEYDFSFTPSYFYPTGSTIIITMNTFKYQQINKSNPPATCTTNFASITAACIITSATITVTLNGQLNEGFAGVITAIGVKNPTFVGTTSATDILITAFHPIGNRIDTQYTNTLTYLPAKNINTILFKIQLSSYYSQVSSVYTFTLQNTNALPPLGILNIMLPLTWSTLLTSPVIVSSIYGGFTSDLLVFQQAAITQPAGNILLQITPQFQWPSKSTLIIVLSPIINPVGITTTEPISIYTQYDSVTIDQSDTSDPTSTITLLPYNPKIKMWNTTFTPRNEGEIAEYDLSITCDDPITYGQIVVFQFPAGYDALLTLATLSISCTSGSHPIGPCTVSGGAVSIPVLANVAIREQIDFIIKSIANPNKGVVYFVDVSVTNPDGTVVEFVNNAFSVQTLAGATYAPLSNISSANNQILIKSDYQECMNINGNIPLGASIILDFPQQFSMKQSSYVCQLGPNSDPTVLQYTNPNDLGCVTYNNLKRIVISGHLSAYTFPGGASKMICFVVKSLENSVDTGESFHFNMRVFDVVNKLMLYKTAGILNYPSTLTYIRQGLRIFVGTIPDIPIGTMSNDITITLENPVPYDVTLIPSSPNINFIPAQIVFPFYEGQTQTFRINPSVSLANAGQYDISWVKEENTTTNRFSEMPDTFFNVIAQPNYHQLQLTVSQSVYRASIGAQSMPIYVTLSQPASTPMTLFYKTKKPFQPEFVTFTPDSITFQPGDTVASFSYTTTQGAVSGLITLQLQPEFSNLYYLPVTDIDMEIEDVDTTPPSIIDYNIITLQMLSMQMRVSCDESVNVFYICSIKGTLTPLVPEMLDPAVRALSINRPRTPEIQGSQYSNITSSTSSYIYYDSFLNLQGLTPGTQYTIFMMPVDLSGNNGEIKQFDFTTAPVPSAITFSLQSSAFISDTDLLTALSLTSGITQSHFVITYRPAFSSIPTTETEVVSVLNQTNMAYQIMILPDTTVDGPTPYDYLKKIQDQSDTLFSALPTLDQTQIISETGQEVNLDSQKFTYMPQLIDVTNFNAVFNVSIFYSGTVYGVILPAGEPQPSAQQVKGGLTSVNRQVLQYYVTQVSITVNPDKQYKVYPSGILNFTFLYHSSPYVAYFIADRQTYGDPVLMSDSEVLAVPVTTLREIFKVDDSVVDLSEIGSILTVATFWMGAIMLFLLFLK